MKKISVLHLSQVSGGGVEQYIKLFLKYSDKNKFINYLVSPKINNYKDYNDKIEEVFEFNVDQSFSPFKLFKNVLFFRGVLKKVKPDIIYLHSSFAGVIGRLAAFLLPCKVIYNPHSWSFKMNVSPIRKIFYKLIESSLSLLTDKYILISKLEYDLGKSIGINKDKLELIYNGIEVNNQSYSEISLPISATGKYIIGMIGRISEQKNPLFFVEFAKEIYRREKNTFFIIVGDGELRLEVEDKVSEYGLKDNFLITGWVDNPKNYLVLFDQAVLFSKWEGLCLSIAEYMQCKKPILATNIGGINDLVENNNTGLLINEGDLESAVRKSFILRKDLRLNKLLSENAYHKLLSNFSIERQMSEITLMFIKLIKG